MIKKVASAIVLVVTIALALPGTASAHTTSQYFTRTWDTDYEVCFLFFFNCRTEYRDIEYWAIGWWTSESLNSLRRSATQVNNDLPTMQYLNLAYKGMNSRDTSCHSSDYNYNVAAWHDNGSDHWLGSAQVCYNGATTLRNFRILFNSMFYFDFYYGSSGDTPTWGFQQVAMHEFVHGLGFGIGSKYSHFADSTSTSDGTCPHLFDADGNRRNVMCESDYEGTDIYSLRTHDIHTVVPAYGGWAA